MVTGLDFSSFNQGVYVGYGRPKSIFDRMNNIFETVVNKNELYSLAFKCLQEFSPFELQAYQEARSFYPSLIQAMQSRNYEQVIHFLAAFPHDLYPSLITPEIRLCKAACLLQLQSDQFNEAYRECCEKGDLRLLDDRISTSFLGSKEAYQHLKEKVSEVDEVLFKLTDLDLKA